MLLRSPCSRPKAIRLRAALPAPCAPPARSRANATSSSGLIQPSLRRVGRFCAMRGNGRFVYDFDEPSGGGRELLGGKGVGLAEMTQLGIPVPAGFTVTTDACVEYMQNGKKLPGGLE